MITIGAWLGLDLATIKWFQFLALIGIWTGAWLFWHWIGLRTHKWVEKRMPEGLLQKMRQECEGSKDYAYEREQRDRSTRPIPWALYDKYEYRYFFWYPFVLTSKSKIALAAVTTWGIAKYLIIS